MRVLSFLTTLAGAAFWACGALELLALFAPSVPDRFFVSSLGIGIFVVWLPGMAVQARTVNVRGNAGRIAWTSVPQWVHVVGVAAFANAGLMFITGMIVTPTRGSGRVSDPRISTAV